MDEAEPAEALIEAAAGAVRPHATEAFALLGDETRLAILLVLWENYDPHADDDAMPFSEIFGRIDYDSPGSFRYHLEQLDGQFIRQRARRERYELRMPGIKLVQSIIAGAGVHDVTRKATEIDQACPFCDAPTTVRYREGLLVQACTACEGVAPERTGVDGFLNAVKFEPAGVADRSPERLRSVSRIASLRQTRSMFDGVCPTCSGPVDGWLDACLDHVPGGVCESCGYRFPARARFQCRICKDHARTSPKALALFHPAVVSFYDDHDVSIRFHADDPESVLRGFELMDAHGMELVSEDSLEVDVTVTCGEDSIAITFDDTANVVDVRR